MTDTKIIHVASEDKPKIERLEDDSYALLVDSYRIVMPPKFLIALYHQCEGLLFDAENRILDEIPRMPYRYDGLG